MTNAQQWVLDCIAAKPRTGAELDEALEYPSAHKRISELRELRLIKCIGYRFRSTDGQHVRFRRSQVWGLTAKGARVLR